jgi:hypothetical protein
MEIDLLGEFLARKRNPRFLEAELKEAEITLDANVTDGNLAWLRDVMYRYEQHKRRVAIDILFDE